MMSFVLLAEASSRNRLCWVNSSINKDVNNFQYAIYYGKTPAFNEKPFRKYTHLKVMKYAHSFYVFNYHAIR